jgi:hypothetical protein
MRFGNALPNWSGRTRKLLGTTAALLAIVVMPVMNDDPHGALDGGERTALSLSGSDHATTVVPPEERSRGSCSLGEHPSELC